MKNIRMQTFLLAVSLFLSSLLLFSCEKEPEHECYSDTTVCTEDKVCEICRKVIEEAKDHVKASDATCTEPSVCSVCGTVLEEAHGHTPGEAASCLAPQRCTECGIVLAENYEHSFALSEDGTRMICPVCGDTVNASYLPLSETASSGHYTNSIKAYYASNVLICGDYGIEYFKLNTAGSESYAGIVNRFAEKYPSLNVTSLLIPKACAFYSPEGYGDCEENQRQYIASTYAMMNDSVKKADAMSILSEHKGEYTYYRTDHHWTQLGAYYASRAYCLANGITPHELSEYRTVTNVGYTGSLYNYGNHDAHLKTNPDYTVLHLPLHDCTMTYTRGGVTYDGTVINKKTGNYSFAFINGDQPFTDIVTTAATGRKLIVFKESYGNAFVPFMVDYYDEIVVIDIREDTKSVAGIIAEYGITDALIINNVQGAGSLQNYLSAKLAS